MRKNKYQLLADEIRTMVSCIENFYLQVDLLFLEVKVQRPPIQVLPEHSHQYPNYESLDENLIQARWLAYLCCPADISEITKFQAQIHEADFPLSLSAEALSVLNAVQHNQKQEAILKANLSRPVLDEFKETVLKWFESNNLYVEPPKDEKIAFRQPFAPTRETSLFEAYVQVRHAIYARKHKGYMQLMSRWKSRLEILLFRGISWTSSQKHFFIRKWEDQLFSHAPVLNKPPPKGRWPQNRSIDRLKAAILIAHFATSFISESKIKKVFGEIASILWTMIQIAEVSPGEIHLHEVIGLSTEQFNESNQVAHIRHHIIPLSLGLTRLLGVLKGKKKESRAYRLFPNLTEDKLQDILKKTSIAMFDEEILPGAFLLPPHPFTGLRLLFQQHLAFTNNLEPDQIYCVANTHFFEKELKKHIQ